MTILNELRGFRTFPLLDVILDKWKERYTRGNSKHALSELKKLLSENNYRVLGNGALGITFQPPTRNYVIKIYQDHAYSRVARVMKEHAQDVHMPKIIWGPVTIRTSNQTPIQAVVMEELKPISGLFEQIVDDDMFPSYANAYTSKHAFMREVEKNIRYGFYSIRPQSAKANYIRNICSELYDTLEKFKNVNPSGNNYYDLHSGNFMQRANGVIVVTDPIYDDFGGGYSNTSYSSRDSSDSTYSSSSETSEIDSNLDESTYMGLFENDDDIVYHPAVRSFLDIVNTSGNNYIYELNKNGYATLGQGAYGVVMHSPQGKGDYVIKTWKSDRGYDRALECFEAHSDNPHFPRVLAGPIRNVPNVHNVVFLDEMQPLHDQSKGAWVAEAQLCIHMAINKFYGPYIDIEHAIRQTFLDASSHDRVRIQINGLVDALTILKTYMSNSVFDLHYGNFMKNPDGNIVITDPFAL